MMEAWINGRTHVPALVPVLQRATAGICQVFEQALERAVVSVTVVMTNLDCA